MLTRDHVEEVIDLYIRAWTEKDADLIMTIFTPSALYHERVLDEPIRGRDGIRRYWIEKVVQSQDHIDCRLLSLYLDGRTAIVEWEALFDDLADGFRRRMREVAILEFEGGLIASLREYWCSKPMGIVDRRT